MGSVRKHNNSIILCVTYTTQLVVTHPLELLPVVVVNACIATSEPPLSPDTIYCNYCIRTLGNLLGNEQQKEV